MVGYDPVAIENAKKILGRRIEYADSTRSCLNRADAALIVTEWEEFNELSPIDFKDKMPHPVLIDARRIYDPGKYGSSLVYSAVGLGKSA